MTQKEKSLLLQDLCARLLYGVIVDYKENEFELPHWKITAIYPETMDGWISYYKRIGAGSESGSKPFKIGEVKPYLRPMSSMTEEERKEIEELIKSHKPSPDGIINNKGMDNLLFSVSSTSGYLIDWLNAHHFDYRGLIEKGLALEAPKDMYNFE